MRWRANPLSCFWLGYVQCPLKFDDMKGDVKILSEGFARLQDEVKELREDCMCIYQRLLRAVLIFVCGDVWGRNQKTKTKKRGKRKETPVVCFAPDNRSKECSVMPGLT